MGYLSLFGGTLGRCVDYLSLFWCRVQDRMGWDILASFCVMVSKNGVRYPGLFLSHVNGSMGYVSLFLCVWAMLASFVYGLC